MLKLKKHLTFRIPDRLAVAAVVALMVTVAVGMPGNRFTFDGDPASLEDSRNTTARVETTEATGASAVTDRGFKLRLLLFRSG
jgi:hypothetical protein